MSQLLTYTLCDVQEGYFFSCDTCLVGGSLGTGHSVSSLLSCIVKKEHQKRLERKILMFKDKSVQGWMRLAYTATDS